MKKFVIRNADGSAQDVMPALHSSRKEALLTILDYATKVVEDDKDDSRIEIPIDYMVKEIAERDVNELVTDFESAKKVIGSTEFILAKESLRFSDVELNMGHARALIALNELFTIAQAWNRLDDFVPNFSNYLQRKWFPVFEYSENDMKFVCIGTNTEGFGLQICFKSCERARQFGKQFENLYNKVFL